MTSSPSQAVCRLCIDGGSPTPRPLAEPCPSGDYMLVHGNHVSGGTGCCPTSAGWSRSPKEPADDGQQCSLGGGTGDSFIVCLPPILICILSVGLHEHTALLQ